MGVSYNRSNSDEESSIDFKLLINRRFIPSKLYPQVLDFDSTLYDDGEAWTYVPCPYMDPCKCGNLIRHLDCIFIAIDGACRGNGTASAESSIGVYFAESSRWNVARRLDYLATTNQKAELQACLEALKVAHSIQTNGVKELSQIVIKADSEYVVKGMTEWVVKWKRNGFKNCKGENVLNKDLFKQINQMIEQLDGEGVEVFFWHVPRAQNKEADALANSAF